MNKKILFSGILALVFSFTGCDQGTGTSPESVALTTLDFNTDGAGYATVATEAMLAADLEKPERIPLPEANPAKIAPAVGYAVDNAFFGASSWFEPALMGQAVNDRPGFYLLTMFSPERISETVSKLNSFPSKLNEIQNSIVELQTQIRESEQLTEAWFRLYSGSRYDLGDYLTQITDAAAATQFLGNDRSLSLSNAETTFTQSLWHGNFGGSISSVELEPFETARFSLWHGNFGGSLSLSKAGMTFMAVDGRIITGPLAKLNNADSYADACLGLYSTGNPYIGIEENHNLYDNYRQLVDIILGTSGQWDGLSAIDAYSAFLSLARCDDARDKRWAFTDSIRDTHEVLKIYLLRAIRYDLEFNKALYEATDAIYNDADASLGDRLEARKIAGIALNNYLYDRDTLLDPSAENIGSITFMNAQVDAALKQAWQ